MRRSIFTIMLITVGLFMLSGAVIAQEDTAQSNKEALQSALTAFNSGDMEALSMLFPEQFMMTQGGISLEPMMRSDVEGFNAMLLAAIPDLQIVLNVVIAQEDWVVAHMTYTGTFTNALNFGMELDPTNDIVAWTEMNFMHFEDGLVVENWNMSDPMIMLSQLGMFPPSEDSLSDMPPAIAMGYQTLSADELATTFTSGMEDRNINLLHDFADTGLGVDDSDYYAENYISWNSGTAYQYIADVQVVEDMAFTGFIATAMPDYVIDTPIIVAEGDWVAVLVNISGTFTHDTEFFGTPLIATGEPIVWQLGSIYRYDTNGKIVELWHETDTTSLFTGLGLMSMDEE